MIQASPVQNQMSVRVCRISWQACRLGRIDSILVKSISRFSRNTTDCLSIVRELLEIGVTVSFEKENIDTGSMESELILSILSSMAEDESASISQNEKWSIKRKFHNAVSFSAGQSNG